MFKIKVFKNLLYSLFLIFFSINCVFAYTDNDYLSKIEEELYHNTYTQESITKRLVRIEKSVYGKNIKLSQAKRIEKLKKIFVYKRPELKEPKLIKVNNRSNLSDYARYPQITQMEKMVFSNSYEKDNIYKRLERLELAVYNKKSNEALMNRVDNLKATLLGVTPVQEPKIAVNTGSNYNTTNIPYNNAAALSELENLVFKTTYPRESPEQRLRRLEMKIFNRTSDGDTLNQRIERLAAVIQAESSSDEYRDMSTMRQSQQATKTITLVGIGLMILQGLLF